MFKARPIDATLLSSTGGVYYVADAEAFAKAYAEFLWGMTNFCAKVPAVLVPPVDFPCLIMFDSDKRTNWYHSCPLRHWTLHKDGVDNDPSVSSRPDNVW